jgi:hypothetical protein
MSLVQSRHRAPSHTIRGTCTNPDCSRLHSLYWSPASRPAARLRARTAGAASGLNQCVSAFIKLRWAFTLPSTLHYWFLSERRFKTSIKSRILPIRSTFIRFERERLQYKRSRDGLSWRFSNPSLPVTRKTMEVAASQGWKWRRSSLVIAGRAKPKTLLTAFVFTLPVMIVWNFRSGDEFCCFQQ